MCRNARTPKGYGKRWRRWARARLTEQAMFPVQFAKLVAAERSLDDALALVAEVERAGSVKKYGKKLQIVFVEFADSQFMYWAARFCLVVQILVYVFPEYFLGTEVPFWSALGRHSWMGTIFLLLCGAVSKAWFHPEDVDSSDGVVQLE